MIHIVIGALAMLGFTLLARYVRRNELSISWWQWAVTILAFMYAVFVSEMIVSFFQEGAERAALVMGVILGFVGVVWAVLLARFVFTRRSG
ncbi:MAG: hypothetical protein PVH84_00815 [Candidatus Aminicenantes bacterium]|jgi:uncharacterized membrane-anchored protein